MRGLVFALTLAAAGCLGRYDAPTSPPPAKPQPSPAPSSPSPTPTPSPTSPSPAPPQTPPTPTPTPTGSDGGAPAPTPGSDGGTTSACGQLTACCDLLPPDDVQGCLDQVAGLDEQSCQGILDQLQANGYCL
jgi:hypothetical protein